MTLLTLSSLLIEGRHDDHVVALRHNEPIRFDRFRADVANAAGQFELSQCGALVCQDSYNFIVGFYGLLHAGARIVFPPNGQAGTLQSLRKEFDFLVDDAAIQKCQNEFVVLTPLDSARLALDFFTSGSTGTPSRITKSLAMLECELAILDAMWGQELGQGSVFATVSHQHIFGLTFKLLWPLAAGRPFTAEMHSLWEMLLTELTPDAVIISSPAHLGRLDGVSPLPLQQRPKRIFSAGAPLPLAASNQTEAIFGCRPTEIFGSTETGAVATRCQLNDDEPWRLLPGITMRCDNDGRLVLRSPFAGPDWVTTADLVEPLPGGFRFRGRADRIAKIEGKRISLTEIEQALARLPYIAAVAVALLPGEPDRLAAIVVPSEEGRITLSKLGNFRFGRFLRKALTSTQEAAGLPRLWRFVEELPMQGMGKRRDADLLALFGEDA